MKILILLLAPAIFESIFRLYRFRNLPFSLKFLYSFYLLSKESENEIYTIQQRIERGGFKNLKQLILHYVKTSNKSENKIIELLLPNELSRFVLNKNYYSAFHGVFKQSMLNDIGLVPIKNQNLKGLTIEETGFRLTVNPTEPREKKKIIWIFGGSVSYGLGATDDSNTIASHLSRVLNKNNNKTSYMVYNFGMLGFTSAQEIKLYKYLIKNGYEKPNIVISLSAWNDMGQAFMSGKVNESFLTQSMAKAEIKSKKQTLYMLLSRLYSFKIFERFRVLIKNDKMLNNIYTNQSSEDALYTLY